MVRFIEHRASMLEGRGSYQRAKWERAIALCRPHRRVALDIGAHVGYFAVQAARRGNKVIAVEPNAAAVELLKRNAERNGVSDRIQVIPAALRKGGLRDTHA
jgi:tRNA G37 N-methylase Trm5